MQTPTYSESELANLTQQVDAQLSILWAERDQGFASPALKRQNEPSGNPAADLPAAPEQQAVIEQISGEPFESFWQKYKRHARRDLCLPGGQLHEQWKKWRDLQSGDTVKMSLAALATMGISTANLPVAAVAASVMLLNVVTHIGIQAICEDCAEN